MNYKATIIIPCYNKEKYIARALESVVGLSRFQDFYVIIVDDCSKDSSVSIIRKYESEYSNIRLITFQNSSGSPSKPRNEGIRQSEGDYIIFMDPDDQIINDGYSILLTKMEEYQSDILIATRIGVTDNGNMRFTDYIDERFTFINKKNPSIMLDLLNRRPFILKTIYRKELIIKNNIWFNEKIQTSEDESFDMQCAAYANKITKINDIVYQYTVESENSITTGVSLRMYTDLYDVMTELEKAYKLAFSDQIVYDRIAALIDVFYINKLTFMQNSYDVIEGCGLIFDAFERFGLEKFSSLYDRRRINLIRSIQEQDLLFYISEYYLKRIRYINNERNRAEREKNRALKRNRSIQRKLRRERAMLHRRIVRPSVWLARKIDELKTLKAQNCSSETTADSRMDNPEQSELESLDPQSLKKQQYNYQLNIFLSNISSSQNGYWIFKDRHDSAKDNAEALYRYVRDNGLHDNIAFILSKNSIDYARLADEGFNLIEHGSIEHWLLLFHAEYFFTSHCDSFELYPWFYIEKEIQKNAKTEHRVQALYKLVFIQHGVIRSNLSSWLGGKPFYRFIASSPYEYESLISIPHYRLTNEEVRLTGLARWDYLHNVSHENVVIFPTWRSELTFSESEDFREKLLKSPFYNNWLSLCNSEAIERLSRNHEIIFYGHHDNAKTIEYLRDALPDYINLISYNDITSFSEIVNNAELLITDYSSFSFDFLFLNKPVIYFDFELNAQNNNIRGEEYSNFGYYCSNIEDAERAIYINIDLEFQLPDKLLENINVLLPTRGQCQCKNIIDETIRS